MRPNLVKSLFFVCFLWFVIFVLFQRDCSSCLGDSGILLLVVVVGTTALWSNILCLIANYNHPHPYVKFTVFFMLKWEAVNSKGNPFPFPPEICKLVNCNSPRLQMVIISVSGGYCILTYSEIWLDFFFCLK